MWRRQEKCVTIWLFCCVLWVWVRVRVYVCARLFLCRLLSSFMCCVVRWHCVTAWLWIKTMLKCLCFCQFLLKPAQICLVKAISYRNWKRREHKRPSFYHSCTHACEQASKHARTHASLSPLHLPNPLPILSLAASFPSSLARSSQCVLHFPFGVHL